MSHINSEVSGFIILSKISLDDSTSSVSVNLLPSRRKCLYKLSWIIIYFLFGYSSIYYSNPICYNYRKGSASWLVHDETIDRTHIITVFKLLQHLRFL